MRKRLILPLLTCLLFVGCGESGYPSTPEAVLKKGIEAIHDNDLNEVNRYIDLVDWDEVLKIRALMRDNDEHLPDKVSIIKTETSEAYKGGGEDRCTIQTKTIRRNGTEDQLYYFLHKTESGKWKMMLGWTTYL